MRAFHAAVAAVAGLAFCHAAFGYGPKGHQMIGAIADAQLTPAAKAAVASNLGYSLRTASTWADCVKDVRRTSTGKFVHDPDPLYAASCKTFSKPVGRDRMIDYARRNWDNCQDSAKRKGCHPLYHFADVAIQQDHYDRAFTGTSDHDIVSAIQAAIARLQGKAVPAPFSIKDNAEAMLMLAHLVGDLHQPLHVGAVYLDVHDAPVDPGPASTPHDAHMDTRGGNQLEVGSSNLHSDWDGVLDSWNPLQPSHEILVLAKAVPATAGDAGEWPALWATETQKASQHAYQGLKFSHKQPKKAGDWVTTFPNRPAYVKDKNEVQKREMATAGARLAQILNAVYP